MLESGMRSKVVAALRSLDAVCVENAARYGTPDVNYVEGWLELKVLARWPRGVVKVPHFTPQQRVWLKRRVRLGGSAHVLILVDKDWLLFDGSWAADKLGHVTKMEMFDNAVFHCTRKLDKVGLNKVLRK